MMFVTNKELTMKLEVVYTVKFVTTIEVQDGQSIQDALNDIDVPEGSGSYYKEKSFEVLDVFDEQGNDVDFQ